MSGLRSTRALRTRGIVGVVTCSLAFGVVAGIAGIAGAAEKKVGLAATGALTPVAMKNPACDPSTGRFKFQFYAAPPCVKEWKAGADNGGATAQGVTRNSIKVVVLWHELPSEQITGEVGVYTNQATGKNELGAARAALLDENEVFKHVYETWGRTVEYEFVQSTGSDETAQRADAIAIAAMKPFAVLDLASAIATPGVGGGRVFEQALVNAKVPLVQPRPTEPLQTSQAYALTTAEFVKKQLAGGKAQYADPSMTSLPRKYGVLHSSNFDVDYLNAQFKKLKLPVPVDAQFEVPATQSDTRTDAASVSEVMPTLITRLKDAGVTTLIMATNHSVAGAASKVMAQQEWYPEVVLTSSPYQDLDLFARGYDQRVWSHAFGMVWFPPYLAGHADETAAAFQWFWGTDRGTRWSIAFFQMLGLYSAIQFVGPNLTAKSVSPGVLARIFSKGVAAGGYYSKSAFTIEIRVAAPGKINPRGVAMAWYNPDATGPGNYNLGGDGKGKYVYLNGGKRFLTGHLPTAKQKFFDVSASSVTFETLPASEPRFPNYQCVGCPSTGATDIVPAAQAS
jgi:hypothetical protein